MHVNCIPQAHTLMLLYEIMSIIYHGRKGPSNCLVFQQLLLLFLSFHACAPRPDNVCDIFAVFAMEDTSGTICALSKCNPFILETHIHIFVVIPLKSR